MIELAIIGLCVFPALVIFAAVKFVFALADCEWPLSREGQGIRESIFLDRQGLRYVAPPSCAWELEDAA